MTETTHKIPLQWPGTFAVVDAQDRELVEQYRWYAHRGRSTTYVRADVYSGGKRTRVYLHRLISGAGTGELTDHRDGDGLNNRRGNLRVCSAGQNTHNTGSRGGSSRYKGVSWSAKRGKWTAQIVAHGRHHALGRVDDELLAAARYDVAARILHGPFAQSNLGVAFLTKDPATGEWFDPMERGANT